MKIRHLIWVFSTIILTMIACDEFIERSLSGKSVALLAPGERFESRHYTVAFWWEPVDGALGYRLQIVSPSFDSIKYMLADTLVSGTKFNFQMEPGNFEWRVRAENGSSTGSYNKRSFVVHVSSIKDEQVLLLSPATNYVTNKQGFTYKWESLFGAQKYRIQIDTNNFSDENTLIANTVTTNTELTQAFSIEKTYQWRVRAESDSLSSRWSAIRLITYDKTAPDQVILSSPSAGQLIQSPVSMEWAPVSGASAYQLLVLKSDSTSAYNSTFPLTLTNTAYSFSSSTPNEKLYWKVRALDAAGNAGVYSEMRSFTIR